MKQIKVFGVAAALLVSTAAQAQSAGDFVAGFGWFHFSPQDSSKPLTVNALGTSVTETGSGASVDNSDTFGFTATYFFTDHIATTAVFGQFSASQRVYSASVRVGYAITPFLAGSLSYQYYRSLQLNAQTDTSVILLALNFNPT